MKKGLETLKARGENCPRFASVLLLTDGQPNNKPPEGELKALQAFLIDPLSVATCCGPP